MPIIALELYCLVLSLKGRFFGMNQWHTKFFENFTLYQPFVWLSSNLRCQRASRESGQVFQKTLSGMYPYLMTFCCYLHLCLTFKLRQFLLVGVCQVVTTSVTGDNTLETFLVHILILYFAGALVPVR